MRENMPDQDFRMLITDFSDHAEFVTTKIEDNSVPNLIRAWEELADIAEAPELRLANQLVPAVESRPRRTVLRMTFEKLTKLSPR